MECRQQLQTDWNVGYNLKMHELVTCDDAIGFILSFNLQTVTTQYTEE